MAAMRRSAAGRTRISARTATLTNEGTWRSGRFLLRIASPLIAYQVWLITEANDEKRRWRVSNNPPAALFTRKGTELVPAHFTVNNCRSRYSVRADKAYSNGRGRWHSSR